MPKIISFSVIIKSDDFEAEGITREVLMAIPESERAGYAIGISYIPECNVKPFIVEVKHVGMIPDCVEVQETLSCPSCGLSFAIQDDDE